MSSITFIAAVSEAGRIVDWASFKRGRFIDYSEGLGRWGTVLTDVVVRTMEACTSMDPSCRIEVLRANGFLSSSFDLTIIGEGFRVLCQRRCAAHLLRVLRNPLLFDDPQSYQVTVTIEANTKEMSDLLLRKIRGTKEDGATL